MRITKITIKNYKSIKEITIPLQCYGDSYTTFLIGVNESGKSNILDAIKLLNTKSDNQNEVIYENDFHKGAESGEQISIIADIDLQTTNSMKFQKCVIINQKNTIRTRIVDMSSNTKLRDRGLIEDINKEFPEIITWACSDVDLIDGLVECTDNGSFNYNKLRSLFSISGKQDVNDEIQKSMSNLQYRDTLQPQLNKDVEDFLNSTWQNNSFKICTFIDSVSKLIKVQVEDKDNPDIRFSMSQRSAGFKQFMSLLLALSAKNKNNELKNNIILIDEPETHLHPSAIRSMRDELLKLGENNQVIVATHSNYMIDTEHPERHLLLKKEKGETLITQLDKNSDFYDDEVLYPAFGLNVFNELLSENIIVVEGKSDKMIISHAIRLLSPMSLFFVDAGGVGNCPKLARLLCDKKIKAFVLVDADNHGINAQRAILNKQQDSYSPENVCTLKDLVPSLHDNSTLEDLLPIDFVKTNMNMPELNEMTPIISQLRIKDTDNFKVDLAAAFCEQYTKKEQVEKEAPKLSKLVKELIRKLNA